MMVAACSSQGEVIGLVTSVDGDLEQIQSFVVLVDGIEYVFVPAADGDFAFPLSHLREHLRSTDPVRVTYQEMEGRLMATTVDDG